MSPYCSVYFVISLQFIFYITFKFWYAVPQVFKICYLCNNITIYHNSYPLYVVPPRCHWFSFCAGYGHFVFLIPSKGRSGPTHIEINYWNKLKVNSASCWFSLYGCITAHGQQNIKFKHLVFVIFVISCRLSKQEAILVQTCVKFINKNPTRCNIVSKFYYSIFIWSSTCFGRHTAHNQKPKTALAASYFSYVEGCWTWWTLSGTLCLTTSTNYTSNNLPRMRNQRLPVQF